MRALDQPARDAGVMLLNETGLDPGIDHMSAIKIIHNVQDRGGKVVSFKSYCGGLPAPDCNDNPWGYKFSWSPRAVCTACKNAAAYQLDGKKVHIPGPKLFSDCTPGMHFDGIGELEAYPNRDSLSYIDLYGLTGIDTMMRCTLRYPGWCETMKSVVDLGLLDEMTTTQPVGTTFADFMATFVTGGSGSDIRRRVADQLCQDASSGAMQRFDWLGLFGNDPIPKAGLETTPLDILATRMAEKMSYGENERDMIVLRHEFRATFPSSPTERIVSTLIEFGSAGVDSAMARTVSLPSAVAAKLILSGAIHASGVHLPVLPEIYTRVLGELAGMGVACVEQTFLDG
ncbi:MAG: saccharopine dehydrogenase [Planctomycetes bacterium]|nr:saccharopine dehydrogenase [Planctomycetota bacterium]